ncbi:Ribonuclease H [Ruminiclostridium papyrosolvens DSM 2782]|uniref:Ribonuclease H n=1 Tax=Ruminiclostridium papyrosolvens DSM 2782 TaxID=588581 RepID=F1T9Y0_9FIRM|nr:ribonuclease HI [Ruminiclostridium papyrosolvens]EGD48722.1 Ribonuclease H [Ruminiclostridium papyrosolvens DSM 2782]WES32522.1 ribonuclease HI [Ruminiclostridium papyrosolvens DSM 2782]
MKQVEIYTDGACSGNPGAGGWGAVLMYGEHKVEISGFEKSTTNNKMELTAAFEALKRLKEPCKVNLYSDSAYLVNAFLQGWLDKWIKNGWKRNKNEEVKNIELWKELVRLADIHEIKWIKVKGHADNVYNNRCDKLATDEIKKNC